ncbi:MAG TPA: diaminopimelate decarboxylase [Anaerolineae bacterium]|nr:diaminopimelate decarboxylase [Anaerolineae bacterium]
MIEFRSGRAYCQDAPLTDLAPRFGTPLYVYSKQRLAANYRRVSLAFAALGARVCYSVKANGNGAILRLLREWGSGFDVVSGGELYRSLHIGAEPERIVFAGVGKTEAELRFAIESRVGWINVEAREELEALDAIAAALGRRPRVALRLNPAVEADTHHHIATGGRRSKFGIDRDEAGRLLADAARFAQLDLAGLHIHIGSQLASPQATVAAVRTALTLIERYRLPMLDIGGGFPVDYHPGDSIPLPEPSAFAEALTPWLRDRGLELLIEPGRSIVADAGLLLTRVLNVKQRAGRQIVVVDAGMNDLLRPALYDAYHPIVPLDPGPGEPVATDVVGPVCESADAFARDRALPPLKRGDLLAITHAGAYGMAMSSNYNSRPRPAEVLIDGASVALIRRRETLEDLVATEIKDEEGG